MPKSPRITSKSTFDIHKAHRDKISEMEQLQKDYQSLLAANSLLSNSLGESQRQQGRVEKMLADSEAAHARAVHTCSTLRAEMEQKDLKMLDQAAEILSYKNQVGDLTVKLNRVETSLHKMIDLVGSVSLSHTPDICAQYKRALEEIALIDLELHSAEDGSMYYKTAQGTVRTLTVDHGDAVQTARGALGISRSL